MFRTAVVFAVSMLVGSALACENKSACSMKDASYKTAAMTGELPAGAAQAHFTVTGMDCGNCAKELRASIEAIEGVKMALVNMDTGMVDVAYDASKVKVQAIQDAINKAHEGKYSAKQS
jgi:copper chaperone